MVQHKSHYKTIVNIWFKELFKEMEEYKFDEMEDIFAFSPNRTRNVPRQTNEVVKALQLMRRPASFDAKIRQEIVSLPDEVSNVEVLTNITNKESANKLTKKVNYALKLTEGYNVRLQKELEDRKKLGVLLKDYTAAQKEIQLRAKERLKKYKGKLVKIRKLRNEIKSHVQKLPDLRRLPVMTGELGPLPSVGDLFKAKN